MAKKIIDGTQYSIVAIIFKDDDVLMFKRVGEEWETGWEYVKGAVHTTETDIEAAYREVDEEAGVKVEILDKLPEPYLSKKPFKDGFLNIHATVFVCKYLSGNVRLGEEEHVDFKWMNINEACQNVWLKNGDQLIRKAYSIYKNKN